MISILLVEDSATSREHLCFILNAYPGLQVAAVAHNGLEAIQLVEKKQPHIIVMDINMPIMDGYETTRRLLEHYSIPIVIYSSVWQTREAVQSFMAIEVGAVAALPKPVGPGHPNFEKEAGSFAQTVKAMAEVRVVRRRSTPKNKQTLPPSKKFQSCFKDSKDPLKKHSLPTLKNIKVIVVGASTGGPPVIKTLLCGIQEDIPVPMVIVQHIAHGFMDGMLDWLRMHVQQTLRVPMHGERLQPGTVYFAGDNQHLGIRDNTFFFDSHTQPEHGLRPSASYLFRSLVKKDSKSTIAILLTGMGTDGAAELKELKDQGATTIVQDKASSLVFGMPGEAVKLGAAHHILPPEEICLLLNTLFKEKA